MIFLDSSVWIAASLSEQGASAEIIRQVINKRLPVISSPDVFEEVTRNLNEKYPVKVQSFLALFDSVHAVLIQPDKKTILKAKKLINVFDAVILAAAMKANCDFFITLDRKHFIQPRVMGAVSFPILLPGDFLNKYLTK
ncbi:MAG: putative toxin-antitoxin system toxin component, PIN family [Candidatus Doudnabacteria bacterium]|nr:putative toxin-antitoxin system toxin component, PIN family [Candidatus Doudnabacteria bacterium]